MVFGLYQARKNLGIDLFTDVAARGSMVTEGCLCSAFTFLCRINRLVISLIKAFVVGYQPVQRSLLESEISLSPLIKVRLTLHITAIIFTDLIWGESLWISLADKYWRR